MSVLGLIPARGGSKGIPRKNIVPLVGKPLIAYTIEAAQASSTIDRIVTSTDSAEIADIAKKWGAEVPFSRPAELAVEDAPALPVIVHAVRWLEQHENYRPDYIVLLQPTSPLRTSRHIDEAVALLRRSGADSVISVEPVPHNYSPASVMTLEGGVLSSYEPMDERKHLRQLQPVFYARNGAVYAFTRQCLLEKNSIYGDRILGYEMDRRESVDIDEPFDLELCEWLLGRSEEKA